MNTVKPLTRTRRTPTRKTWGRGSTGTGTGWPGIPQGYPWYSLLKPPSLLQLCVGCPLPPATRPLPYVSLLLHNHDDA